MKNLKIKTFFIQLYEIFLSNGQLRRGILINIKDEKRNSAWGEVAPLPNWSQETLEASLMQLNQKRQEIISIDWSAGNCLEEIENLKLLPSVEFGLEAALLSILSPIASSIVPTSALLMGSPREIRQQAKLRHYEGYTSAKLKVSNLNFKEATELIHQLKDTFHLRIDVNRAWNTADSLRFFEQFSLDTFDYVEEPFQNPNHLALFPHPLAVDESFPQDLCLNQLESLPTLKALIYKPTIQGGMTGGLFLREWAAKRKVNLVLSSSFESDLGLIQVASMAYRLSLSAPIGIGTYYYLTHLICTPSLKFSHSFALIPQHFNIKLTIFN